MNFEVRAPPLKHFTELEYTSLSLEERFQPKTFELPVFYFTFLELAG